MFGTKKVGFELFYYSIQCLEHIKNELNSFIFLIYFTAVHTWLNKSKNVNQLKLKLYNSLKSNQNWVDFYLYATKYKRIS